MSYLDHEAPLVWLVREKLHPASTLADRVRALRKKRRKAALVVVPDDDPMEPREPLVEEAP